MPNASCNCFLFSYRVQETDGSFFESFTALSWKQENRRLMAMQEIEGRAEDSPPSELSVGIKSVENRIHKKEVGITDSLLVVARSNRSRISERLLTSNWTTVRHPRLGYSVEAINQLLFFE
jgi:BAI1-associated protein 3